MGPELLLVAKREKKPTGFGDRLRAVREQAGVSLSELGRRTDIAYQTIMKYERGENEPTWPTVLKIAEALGVSTEEFREQ
jgi:transcriptional regulator with XRE-family HTH domain